MAYSPASVTGCARVYRRRSLEAPEVEWVTATGCPLIVISGDGYENTFSSEGM